MAPNINKWEINRAGLFNYWYYEDEVFDFAGGKLLLRGNNGAGKSVTMQSFLPVLLDGSTRPERLDPFGSKARRMEDYLLGEKEVAGHEERTGYLYMEFKRRNTEQFMTIGIGLKARRGSQLIFWGFIVTDNRRIGKDIFLYNEESHEGSKIKIPLSKIQMRNQLSDGGHLVETRKEYASLVNQYIFGYETIEEYEDLIKLLIQLRSPKLSKDFRPTVIYDILEEALPPLSEEDLRHLSDTIEQMDQTKQQLEQLNRESGAVSTLNKTYSVYNKKVLFDQANGYKKATNNLNIEVENQESRLERKGQLEQDLAELNTKIETHELDKEAAEKQRQRLEKHKVWNLESERQEKAAALNKETDRLIQADKRLQTTRKKEYETRALLDELEMKIQTQEKELIDTVEDMTANAEESSYEETHNSHAEDFKENYKKQYKYDAWETQSGRHLEELEQITEELRELEKVKKVFEDKDRQLGQVTQRRDELRLDEKDWTDWFREEKSKQLDIIHNWVRDAEYLAVPEKMLQSVARTIEHLYTESRYDDVRDPIRDILFEYEAEKREKIASIQSQINSQSDLIEQLNLELNEWKNEKDPDPDTHPLSKAFREKLTADNIAAVPLYSAVEFKSEVDEETQKNIEAALMNSGLLDALITDKEIDLVHDRILKPNPQIMAYTLADILKPDLDEQHGLSNELVDQVLRSILIDESNSETLTVSEKGYYTVGLMTGHAIPVEAVRFIGKNARKRYRDKQIKELKESISLEEGKRSLLTYEQEEFKEKINTAKDQFTLFPNDQDLAEGYKQMTAVQYSIQQVTIQVDRLSEELKDIGAKFNTLKQSLDKQAKQHRLNLSLSSYLEAVKYMRLYEKALNDIKRLQAQVLNDINRHEDLTDRLEELEDEVIEYKGHVNDYQSRIAFINKDIEHINNQIEKEGLLDIRRQIEETQKSIREITETIRFKRDESVSHSKDLDYLDREIREVKERLSFLSKLKAAWVESFNMELSRSLHDFDYEAGLLLEDLAEKVTDAYASMSSQDLSYLNGRLSRVRNDQQDDLIEFSPTQRTIRLSVPDWMKNDSLTNEFALYVNEWKNAAQRELIECLHLAKKVSPYTVEKDLKDQRDRQRVYLDKQDKQLYEEILFQSVGNKLRSRIGRAERWIEEMKALMESRNDSSGLMFSIRWKPRTAETEEELDTKDLVSLLRQDPRLLKDEDIDKVTTHFRTKIERAKALMNDSTELQTLLQVLKQVLDYRRWFSFELSYQRTGDDRKRPLTDNQFNKFSGGEKARAMYIPLFIATYSRYLEAENTAPYLISLDEAFAGVDDKNIADLFEVVEELDFNYIINSQVIWGDYATVSELAISELFRPQNADHVAVIRYLWDGKKKKLLTEDSDEDA